MCWLFDCGGLEADFPEMRTRSAIFATWEITFEEPWGYKCD